MPCYHPLTAFKNENGVFFKDSIDSTLIKLPCGNCIGCRLERSRQWALRLMHELRFHQESSFLTLTYDDDHLPHRGSLDVKHFQDFMKRLRFKLGVKLRFYHCGEYGEKFGRPHYHAVLFGHGFFEDRKDIRKSDRGDETWSSPVLEECWPFGFHRIGAVTFESCAYVARYCTKKVNGPAAEAHYSRICESTGEVYKLKPEYATMSRRPGIGSLHYEKYHREIYPCDYVVSRGHPSKPPRYYDRMLEKHDVTLYEVVKEQRDCALALSSAHDRSPDRLAVREIVKQAQVGCLVRRYEIA